MLFCFKLKFVMLWFSSFVELVCLVHDFIKIPMEKMNEENTKCAQSLLRCFAFELWRFIISSVLQVLNGKLLCFRMDASVRSWIWWATMWGRGWMSWRGKRSHASGCCWRLNWTAPTHRVSVFMYYSSDTDEQEKLFTQMLVVIAGVQMDHVSLLKQFEHLDPHNQNTFEAKDLELLIVTVTPIPNML